VGDRQHNSHARRRAARHRQRSSGLHEEVSRSIGSIQLRSGSADRISGDDAEAAAMSCSRPFGDPITLPGGCELVTLKEARSWLLATIFRWDSAGFGAINTSRGSQRLTRRLYPTEGVMRSKHKEYRQRNHRPSCEHGNPVQHRDIVRRIWTQGTRYRRDMPVVVPSREWPPLLTGPGIPCGQKIRTVDEPVGRSASASLPGA
jgi:hypothetical protein